MIKNELRCRTIYLLAMISVIMLFLAYQVKRPFEIDLGEQGDEAYLDNFWEIETADDLSYRWSSDRSSIFLPAIGGYAPALLRLRLNGSRPAGLPLPTVSLRINGQELTSFIATDGFETYQFAIERETMGISGNLKIEIESEFFVPAEVMGGGDLRKLGVLVDSASVKFQESIGALVLPAPLQMFHLVAAVLALYLLARWLLRPRAASLLAISIMTLLSLWTAVSRTSLMPYSYWLVFIPALGVTAMEYASLGPITVKGVALATILVLAGLWTLSRFTSLLILSASANAPDFGNNYTAAVLLRQGGLIYDLDELAKINEAVIDPPLRGHHTSLLMSYDNPPFTAVLIAPFTLLDFRTAVAGATMLNMLLLFFSLAFILWSERQDLLRYPQWLIALILALNLEPIYHSFYLGQFDLLILFLIAVGYWAYKGHRDLLAGCCLGLATMIKFSPALLVLYFLYKRCYRVFLSATGMMAVLGVLSWVIAGTENWTFFIMNVLPALLKGSAHLENQSLNGFFNRLFVENHFVTDIVLAPSIPRVRTLTLLASLLLVGITASLVRKRITSRDKLRFDLEFSLVVITLPLLSTIAWHHYMTWYILPFVILLNPRLRERLSFQRGLVVAIVASLVYISLYIPIAFYAPVALEGSVRLLLSLRLYAGLLLYALFSYLLVWYDRRHGVPERNDG